MTEQPPSEGVGSPGERAPTSGPEGLDERVKAVVQRKAALRAITLAVSGVGVLIVVLIAGYFWNRSPSSQSQTEVTVGSSPTIYEPPGKIGLPKTVTDAQHQANDTELRDALAANKTYVPALIMDNPKTLDAGPPPPPLSVATQAVPVKQYSYSADQAKLDAASLDHIKLRLAAALEKSTGTRGGIVEVRPDPEGFARQVGADTHASPGAGQGTTPASYTYNATPVVGPAVRDALSTGKGGAKSEQEQATAAGGEILALPHRAYGIVDIAADSDAPAPVVVTILSGPFSGATITGSFNPGYDTGSLIFDSMSLKGHSGDIAINAVAVNPEQMSPALPAETDERYFQRVILPAAAGFISAAANSLAAPQQTVVLNNGIATQSSPARTVKQDIGAGIGGGATAASAVINAQASAIKRRVYLPAQQPIYIWFVKSVRG
jgi:hypothetical protein